MVPLPFIKLLNPRILFTMSSFTTIMANDLRQMISKGEKLNIIDVRETFEFKKCHIPTSKNMPLSAFDLDLLNKKDVYYLVCETGDRSIQACRVLAEHGYQVVNVMGGTSAYRGVMR